MAHTEIFPGSKGDLEDITGNKYEAMRGDDGGLLQVGIDGGMRCFQERSLFRKAIHVPYPWGKEETDKLLREEAEQIGANALVHVNYLTIPTLRNFDEVVCQLIATGYALRLVK